MDITFINEKDQSFAEEKLKNYYQNNLIPAEKKAYLTELQNNIGPYMGIESSEGKTHYLLDAASQIATLGIGFSPMSFKGVSQFKASWNNNPKDPQFLKVDNAFHAFLLRKLNWKNLDKIYCNSGAEANEIALGLAYHKRRNKKANKVLAFEGSFHGRMMISLFSTWNPSKREPFQWPGRETTFTDYPELPGNEIEQSIPEQWEKNWNQSAKNDFNINIFNTSKDAILEKEVQCLSKIRDIFLKGEHFAIVIEPMQCEGGDRYSSNRFNSALLNMAKAFNVALIFDEVQTGFHLGRDFFWHSQFNIKDQFGNQLKPDYVVCAKKAQVGMVLAPETIQHPLIKDNQQFQVASVIRGYIHGLCLDQSRTKIFEIEEKCKKKLNDWQKKFKDHLKRPRNLGLSFAIDLKDEKLVNEFIAKRFTHGLLYYPAGNSTLRFRMNTAFKDEDIEFLFDRLNAISEELFNGKKQEFSGILKTKRKLTKKLFDWHTLLTFAGKTQNCSFEQAFRTVENAFSEIFKTLNLKGEVILIDQKNFSQYSKDILEIQKSTYEPTRQTEIERFEKCANSEYAINLALKVNDDIAAIAFASSLKDHPLERGLRQDPDFQNPKSLYMIDTTVIQKYHSLGLGFNIKCALTYLAKIKGYDSIKGRNRDQLAGGMLGINLALGSYEMAFLKEDYPDFEEFRDVHYYSTPLTWNRSPVNLLGNRLNSSIEADDLSEVFVKDQTPYLANKVCLSNFVSERFLAHLKEIFNILPQSLQHGYSASGQSECVDKIMKSIIYQQKEKRGERFHQNGSIISFQNHHFGVGSFLSRSLSAHEDCYFPVKHFERPNQSNWKEVLISLSQYVNETKVNSIWIEIVSQFDFQAVPREFLIELKKLANNQDIPLIYNETSSQQFTYDDNHYFAANDSEICPDAGLIFLGGQAGLVFIKNELFLEKPLMMISTWDGDEHAFASYHKAMKEILSQHKDFLKTRSDFHSKLIEMLSSYPLSQNSLNKGRGLIFGDISDDLRILMREDLKGYICDPSYKAMKNFLKSS